VFVCFRAPLQAMTEMTLAATGKKYRFTHDKGLYAKVLAKPVELDIDIVILLKVMSYNPRL
jgi:hypothetical protein